MPSECPLYETLELEYSRSGPVKMTMSTADNFLSPYRGFGAPQDSSSHAASQSTSTISHGRPEFDIKELSRSNLATVRTNCAHHSSNFGKNLVVGIDGTDKEFSDFNTNVVALFRRLDKSKPQKQLVKYVRGIGTEKVFGRIVDKAVARTFKQNVIEAYNWLSEYYEDGDRIFLFGFSRGAYQVRVVAGMIAEVGLLQRGSAKQGSVAYELYTESKNIKIRVNSRQNTKHEKSSPNDAVKNAKLSAFKKTFSRQPEVKVHFIGVWDTVSSIGISGGTNYLETSADVLDSCAFRQALALDECRVKFLPEYAAGGEGPSGQGDVKEVWFVGTHSDVGGGNIPNLNCDIAGPALRWMTYEAIDYGLRVEPYDGQWRTVTPTESLSIGWGVLEILPLRRLSYKGSKSTTVWPHLGGPRVVKVSQHIHQSVLSAMQEGPYRPKARIDQTSRNMASWSTEDLRETDKHVSAGRILDALKTDSRSKDALDELCELTASESGRHSIVEYPDSIVILLTVLIAQYQNDDTCDYSIVSSLFKALQGFPPSPSDARKSPFSEVHTLISTAPEKDMATLKNVLIHIGKWPFHTYQSSNSSPFQVHEATISAVAISGDETRIVTAQAKTVRVWDAQSGEEVGHPLSGHTEPVNCVAISPSGKIVSGSKDHTVRVWDMQTGLPAVAPLPVVLRAHTDAVQSVAVLADGRRVISGSSDTTICVWDIDAPKPLTQRLSGHMDEVTSVAASVDGKHIVSGSLDKTIRIWDVETGAVLRQLTGHDRGVRSVALSLQGSIISGSDDRTIRRWNMHTGDEIQKIGGHTGRVLSVSVSLDGSRIVSAAQDKSIRVWAAQDGGHVAEVKGLLNRDLAPVTTVAISSSGSHIVSDSTDRLQKIRIWQVEGGKEVLRLMKGYPNQSSSTLLGTQGTP